MEIHKPKPWHNLREFLKEFATIVLGVSVALAAEQGVEWLHWQSQVKEAREVIATELAANLASGATRVRTTSCTDRRLDELARVLDDAARKGDLPPLGTFNMPPRFIWPTGTWESIVASQTATHFPRQQLADMAGTYKFIQRLEFFSAREIEAWEALYSMAGPGRRLDPASEADLRRALSSARYNNAVMTSLSLQMAERIQGLHLPFSQADIDSIAGARREPATPNPVCRPLGTPTDFYGQAGTGSVTGDLGTRMDNALSKLRTEGAP